MASHHPIRKLVIPEPPVIPDKLYFRIGDVARLCEIPAYVLRFWETEFPQLKPNKGGTGQRLYRKRDVETALRIKSLLYDQGYTIAGARQVFLSESKTKEAPEITAHPLASTPPAETQPTIDLGAAIRHDAQHREQLCTLRDELRSLANFLAKNASSHHPAPTAKENLSPDSASSKIKPLRPRLVLEPKSDHKPEHKPDARSEPHLLNQGDLFPTE